MRTRTQTGIAIFTGAFLFNWLFNGAGLGINLILFISFLSLLLFVFSKTPENEARFFRTTTSTALVCLVVSAIAVLLQASWLSIVALIVAMLVFAGFVHGVKVRQPLIALMGAISKTGTALFESDLLAGGATGQVEQPVFKWRKIWLYTRISILPLIITVVFYSLYTAANSTFYVYSLEVVDQIGVFFSKYLRLSWSGLGLIIIGALFAAACTLGFVLNWFDKVEEPFSDQMVRSKDHFVFRKNILALKYESRSGVIMLVMLNLLLLMFHFVDIPSVWWNFDLPNVPARRYSSAVHYGVYTLIFCILLSMLVLLYYFRANQHFYKRNKWLRGLAYLWLLQNALLVVSVAMRDYWYIFNLGLSYKRLGVIAYLLMVLFGLATLAWKIWGNRSTYFLLRINSWFALFLLCGSALVNWDLYIGRYNLSSTQQVEIDYRYLTTLSDRVLPAFYERLEELEESEPSLSNEIRSRGMARLALLEKKNWRSWNLADHNTHKLLSSQTDYYANPK